MNILWLTWRDIKNPEAGGAEKVAIEVASRLVKDQIPVTLFSSHFANAKNQENVRGVKIVRRGGLITCRLFAFLYYIRRTNEFDLIIDEINTIPFLTPLWAKNKSITIIYQLAKEYWFKKIIWPLNIVGYLLESLMLSIYKNQKVLTLSSSTMNDLYKFKFSDVNIFPTGTDHKGKIPTIKKPLIIFLGRLTKAKNPEDAIKAFKFIYSKLPVYQLYIIGRGKDTYVKYLRNLASSLNLSNKIHFLGFVSDKEKIRLLKEAKLILIPSIREGWGLVVNEANATGCVPIGYDIAGLKDSIKNNVTGLLVKSRPDSLAQAALKVLRNDKLRKKLIQNGFKLSQQYSWEKTYQDFKAFL